MVIYRGDELFKNNALFVNSLVYHLRVKLKIFLIILNNILRSYINLILAVYIVRNMCDMFTLKMKFLIGPFV